MIPRGELLAELMRLKYGIAVAGSHGKTTTTSMVAAILIHAGLDPTVVWWADAWASGGSNARLGKSDYLVVESDESDGSFLKLAPIMAVVTNIDREHLDHYSGIEEIREAFADFIAKVPFYGAAILCLDDENVQQILPGVNRRMVTYGVSAQADLRITNSRRAHRQANFNLHRGPRSGLFPPAGARRRTMYLNAAAAVAVALELEVPMDNIREGLGRNSPAWIAGSRFAAPSGASLSSTITAIIPLKSARRSPPRARAGLRACTCCFSRTVTPARKR